MIQVSTFSMLHYDSIVEIINNIGLICFVFCLVLWFVSSFRAENIFISSHMLISNYCYDHLLVTSEYELLIQIVCELKSVQLFLFNNNNNSHKNNNTPSKQENERVEKNL